MRLQGINIQLRMFLNVQYIHTPRLVMKYAYSVMYVHEPYTVTKIKISLSLYLKYIFRHGGLVNVTNARSVFVVVVFFKSPSCSKFVLRVRVAVCWGYCTGNVLQSSR